MTGVIQIILFVISITQLFNSNSESDLSTHCLPVNYTSLVVVLGASMEMNFTIEVEFVPELDILS